MNSVEILHLIGFYLAHCSRDSSRNGAALMQGASEWGLSCVVVVCREHSIASMNRTQNFWLFFFSPDRSIYGL